MSTPHDPYSTLQAHDTNVEASSDDDQPEARSIPSFKEFLLSPEPVVEGIDDVIVRSKEPARVIDFSDLDLSDLPDA